MTELTKEEREFFEGMMLCTPLKVRGYIIFQKEIYGRRYRLKRSRLKMQLDLNKKLETFVSDKLTFQQKLQIGSIYSKQMDSKILIINFCKNTRFLWDDVGKRNTEIVSILIDYGADVNAQDKWRETPLHGAVRRSDVVIVKLLLEAGARYDIPNSDGHTAEHFVSHPKKDEIFSLFQ